MNNEEYITQLFESDKPDKENNLSLSLLLTPRSFSYAISGNEFKTVHEICHIELKQSGGMAQPYDDCIAFLVSNYGLLQRKFKKVLISILDSNFTILPHAYAQNDLKPLLEFATGKTPIKSVFRHQLQGADFCFAPDTELYAYLEKTFPNAHIRHNGAVSASLLFSQHSLLHADVFLNIHADLLEIVAKKGQSLLFYNVFAYQTNEDALYYLLYAMEQLQLNPLTVKLHVGAERMVNDNLFAAIKNYVRYTAFCVRQAEITLPGNSSQLPAHYYFNLLNQHLCEL